MFILESLSDYVFLVNLSFPFWYDPEEQVKAHRDGNLLVIEDCKCSSFKLILFLFEKCNLNHFRTKTEIWFCDLTEVDVQWW